MSPSLSPTPKELMFLARTLGSSLGNALGQARRIVSLPFSILGHEADPFGPS